MNARLQALRERLGRPAASTAAARASPSPSATSSSSSPQHLIVLVNGLFGSPANWDVAAAALAAEMTQPNTTATAGASPSSPPPSPPPLLHPSQANSRTATYDGIDSCGQRLADEVRAVVSRYPSLTRISFVCHSMGGLIARYCVAALYDPRAASVAGLVPCHFLTLATPHFGCDAEGVAQVPFVGWAGAVLPQVGRDALRAISPTVAGALFRRTGKQFFLEDGEGGGQEGGDAAALPLLCRMARDDAARGLFFASALASFRTRTAYANVSGDHLVGWANASLRPVGELPPLPSGGGALAAKSAPSSSSSCRYIVREDPPEAAFFAEDPAARRLLAPRPSASEGGGTAGVAAARGRWHAERGPSSARVAQPPVPEEPADDPIEQQQDEDEPARTAMAAAAAEEDLSAGLRAASPPLARELALQAHPEGEPHPLVGVSHPERAAMVADMLLRLRAIPWRRIDVCFSSGGGGTSGGGNGSRSSGGGSAQLLRGLGLAHNNIQVTRRLFNSEGEAVVAHVARTLRELDEALVAEDAGTGVAAAATEAAAGRR